MPTAKKFLITSALPYVNATKHLGNLIGSLLPSDVYARFLRQSGREVLYLCATVDHGTPTELSSAEEGVSPAAYSEKMNAIQKDIYSRFGLSFDHFGRTSSPQNREMTQHFATKMVHGCSGPSPIWTVLHLRRHAPFVLGLGAMHLL